MPYRTLIQALSVAAGVAATLAVGEIAAWGVPLAHDDIWRVAWTCAAVVAWWSIRPLRQAWRADHGGDARG